MLQVAYGLGARGQVAHVLEAESKADEAASGAGNTNVVPDRRG